MAVGILDTRRVTEDVEIKAREVWGDDWRIEFDKLVELKAKSLRLQKIKSTDEILLETKHKMGPDVILSARTVAAVHDGKPRVPTTNEE